MLRASAFVILTCATALEPAVRRASLRRASLGSARRALGNAVAATAALALPHTASAKALDDVLAAAATLDALTLSDRACAQKALSSAPFTDASLPTKGGNVPPSEVPFIPGLYYPKSLFAANYERPLPTIGNALRKNMDAAGRELQFAKPKATMEHLRFEAVQIVERKDADGWTSEERDVVVRVGVGGVVIQDTEEPPDLLAYFPASAIVEAAESTCEDPSLDQGSEKPSC